jgi:hypothetical protein
MHHHAHPWKQHPYVSNISRIITWLLTNTQSLYTDVQPDRDACMDCPISITDITDTGPWVSSRLWWGPATSYTHMQSSSGLIVYSMWHSCLSHTVRTS